MNEVTKQYIQERRDYGNKRSKKMILKEFVESLDETIQSELEYVHFDDPEESRKFFDWMNDVKVICEDYFKIK